MNPLHLKDALISVIPVAQIYIGEIPAGSAPAVGFTHIASPKNKALSGNERGTREYWRVSIAGRTQEEGFNLKELVISLDNTFDANYQRIVVEDEQWHGEYPGSAIAHYTVDLKTILR